MTGDIKSHNCSGKKVSVVPCRVALDRQGGDRGADTPVRELHTHQDLLCDRVATRLLRNKSLTYDVEADRMCYLLSR